MSFLKPKMKLAYICGPYRAENAWEVEQNIRRAEEVALEAWRAGFAVICPHTNTRFFQGAIEDGVWLKGDLEILRRCDLMILVKGCRDSKGSISEIEFADGAGIRIFHTVAGAIKWELQ